MSEVNASTIEGMSVYVENVAENMLEMLESNAKEVMKYESEVISEIGGRLNIHGHGGQRKMIFRATTK